MAGDRSASQRQDQESGRKRWQGRRERDFHLRWNTQQVGKLVLSQVFSPGNQAAAGPGFRR